MNIIDVFARGNQELFHSAFLAWLLNKRSPHNLGSQFLEKVLITLSPKYLYDLKTDYEILTEYPENGCRFDILIRPTHQIEDKRGIVIENKIKSIGGKVQLSKYADLGYDVAALALLPETFEDVGQYPLIQYGQIRDILNSLPLDKKNPYHFIIKEYISHLTNTLCVYDELRNYGNGNIDFETLRQKLSNSLQGINLNSNDIRTFTYFYYHNFSHYLSQISPDLVFGNAHYGNAAENPPNTCWIFERNMQGPPFLESLIYRPFDASIRFRMHSFFEELYKKELFIIAPRVELWIDPKDIQQHEENDKVGEIMLGTWSSSLIDLMNNHETYKSRLRKKGDRNFHYEKVSFKDLPFSKLADRLKRMLSLIGDFK